MTDQGEYPGAPRWVKVVAAITVALILILVALLLLRSPGDHGPGRHLSSSVGVTALSAIGRS